LEWGGDHPISEKHGKIKTRMFCHENHERTLSNKAFVLQKASPKDRTVRVVWENFLPEKDV
jgi:hypothetical protein